MTGKRRDPYLDAGMKNFLVHMSRKELWRVASWYEFEDLLQDGYLCYYKCRNSDRYKVLTSKNHPAKSDRKWMMSLVRTTFENYIHDLARRYAMVTETAVSQLGLEDSELDDVWGIIAPSQPEEATLASMLASAPEEISRLMILLASDSAEALGFYRSRTYVSELYGGLTPRVRRGRRRLRETTNEYYCRLLGLDPRECNLLNRVREYFGTV